MTRPLLLIAGFGFVASLVSFAVAFALGPFHWDDWNSVSRHYSGPSIDGGGPVVTREMTWGGGDEIHINVPAVITYTQGPTTKVVVTGPQGAVDHLKFDDENLSFDRRLHNVGRLQIEMTSPDVQDFVLNGAQKLTIAGYDHDRLEVKVNGAGDVVAHGHARSVETHIAGAGDIDLGGVTSDNGEVHIAGAGKTTLSPKLRAEIHIAGAGDVILTTRPLQLEQHIAGSGRVVQGEAPAAAS